MWNLQTILCLIMKITKITKLTNITIKIQLNLPENTDNHEIVKQFMFMRIDHRSNNFFGSDALIFETKKFVILVSFANKFLESKLTLALTFLVMTLYSLPFASPS